MDAFSKAIFEAYEEWEGRATKIQFSAQQWLDDYYGFEANVSNRLDWWGIPVIESKHVPRGTAYMIGNNQLIWGTGEVDVRTWARREARKIFRQSEIMRKWYEYIGE